MRFVFPELNEPISFEENRTNVLVIENQHLFRTLLQDIYEQINGNEGFSVLSLNNVPVDMSKNAELITTFVPFDANRKTLLSKILASLEKTAIKEEHYLRTQELLAEVKRYFSELVYDMGGEVEEGQITVSSLLKSIGVHIVQNDALEEVHTYMELVREFEKDKLFIFVNMRSYFSDEEMTAFTESAAAHKFKMLFIESMVRPLLKTEKRVIIDEDLCEI